MAGAQNIGLVKRAFREAIALALLSLVPASLATYFYPERLALLAPLREGEITVVAAMRSPEDYLWIDARSVVSYANGHIPAAICLNEDAWDEQFPNVLQAWTTSKPAIVYCDSRVCDASETVAKRLRELKIAPVFVLKGGWEAWLDAQGK